MGVRDLSLDDEFQALHIPKQTASANLTTTEMQPILQTYPLLGQVHCSDDETVHIQAVLKVPRAQAREEWHVALWYSANKSEWSESEFREIDVGRQPQSLQSSSESTIDIYFSTTVSVISSLSFTVKFRRESSKEWTWVRDEYGFDDGVIVRRTRLPASMELSDLIKGLNPELKVREGQSQAPRSRLWSIETSMPCPKGDISSQGTISVGTPWGSFLRWFALVRHSTSWLGPRQGKSHVDLDKDAILCAFLGPNGRHLVFLAVSGIDDTTAVIRYTDHEGLILHARCDAQTENGSSPATLLVGESDDFDCAVAATMYHARSLVAMRNTAQEESDDNLDGEVQPAWLEKWYDSLGYCTWNGIGQELTEKKLFHALDTMAENNIHIDNLILDDRWQSVDSRGSDQSRQGWLNFEADSQAFPKGLNATVQLMRRRYRNLRQVVVWHAMLGYWGGISPDGELAKRYKTIEVDRQDPEDQSKASDKITVIAKEDISQFFQDFFRFLRYSSINGVKTDAQSMLDTLTNSTVRRELSKAYLDAWGLQIMRYFGRRVVSCMSLFPQALFFSGMMAAQVDLLLRTSDDYFPNEPQSHAWHVWANAHNCIFAKHLNVIPDWDMFQTKHEYGAFHAAARCISGGPIWITDVPGEFDLGLIQQMSGTTSRGRTVIFRPSCYGKTITPFTGYQDDVLLKVGSYNGDARTGTPMLAIFNVSQRALAEIITLSSFPGTDPEIAYVIRSHVTGKTSYPMAPGAPGSFLSGSYEVGGYDIWTAAPVQILPSSKHGVIVVGNFGLVGKMTGSVAINRYRIYQKDNGRVFVSTNMKALGVLGIYISSLNRMSLGEDFMITILGRPIPAHTVSVSSGSDCILEVDLALAWLEMDASSGWMNEFIVEISFGS